MKKYLTTHEKRDNTLVGALELEHELRAFREASLETEHGIIDVIVDEKNCSGDVRILHPRNTESKLLMKWTTQDVIDEMLSEHHNDIKSGDITKLSLLYDEIVELSPRDFFNALCKHVSQYVHMYCCDPESVKTL